MHAKGRRSTLFPHDGRNGGGDLSALAFLFMVVSLFTMIYMAFKFWDSTVQFERELAYFAVLQASFVGTGIVFFLIKNRGVNFRITTGGYYFYTILVFFGLTIAGIVIEQLIVGTTEKSSITTLDLIFFYVFAGASEESFYRYFMIGFPLKYSINKPVVGSVVAVVSVVGSSVAFAMSHVYAYGDKPIIMVAQVAVATVWGGYYALTLYLQRETGRSGPRGRMLPGPARPIGNQPWRQIDLLAVMLAHMAKNFAAVPAVLASLKPYLSP